MTEREKGNGAEFLGRVTPELLAKHDRPGPRYTSYPTAVEFHDGFTESDYRERLDAANAKGGPISLYVHIPFCEERCSFCGCNVTITRKRRVADLYLEHLHREIELLAAALPNRRELLQYHWGGGTPTYLDLDQIEALQKKVSEHFRISGGAEVAIEVDPRVTTEDQLKLLRSLGFNRISLGVQDFTREVQEAVNRVQSVEETRRIVDKARELGFGSVNIDLIYGLPRQTIESFGRTLATTIAMRPERVAVYSFAFVPWIRGNQRKLMEEHLPGRDVKFGLFAEAIRSFLAAGYLQIGMDHFALPEDEMGRAATNKTLFRNFMGYTVHKAPDFLGLGVSSIGSVSGAFAQNEKKLVRYYEAIEKGRFPIEKGYVLSEDDRIRAKVIMELMCNFGVMAKDVSEAFGIDFSRYFEKEMAELAEPDGAKDQGFVDVSEEGVQVNPLGRLFIRNVCMIFDPYMRKKRDGRPVFSRTV
ncbi:MAG: oxygen-independent coproporphyrinogen III oxidase [Candidatus Eisenbacteria bacterium]